MNLGVRPSPGGFLAWDVNKLIELTSRTRESGWRSRKFGSCEHVKLMDAADLAFPIVLAADGTVMDGMHRVAKAFRAGLTHIQAVQFNVDPPPDFRDVQPTDLPY